MRLTVVCSMPQNLHRMRSISWQYARRRKIVDDGTAKMLEDSGIQVIDANDFVREDSPLYTNYKLLPDVKPVFPQPLKMDTTHPLWKETPAKVLNTTNFPMLGVNQAQLLTKSVQVKAGLPERILEFARDPSIEKQQHLAENVVQHALIWDAHLDLLPRLRSLDIPVFRYKNSYGIPAETSTEILIRNLLRLCEANFPADASRTVLGGKTNLNVNVGRDGYKVQFQLSPTITILSKHLLRPYSQTDTAELQVPDVLPFNSVANFEEENIYEDDDFLAFKPDSGFPYIHTGCFAHTIAGSFTHVHPRWNADRFGGCTVLYGFATALLMARRKYGANVTTLPEPITTQTVHFTGKEWQFGVFQLNTLDLDEDEGSKNVVWLTDRISLFNKCAFDYDQGRAVFEGYNPEVLKLLYGMYAASTLEPFTELPQTESAAADTEPPPPTQAN